MKPKKNIQQKMLRPLEMDLQFVIRGVIDKLSRCCVQYPLPRIGICALPLWRIPGPSLDTYLASDGSKTLQSFLQVAAQDAVNEMCGPRCSKSDKTCNPGAPGGPRSVSCCPGVPPRKEISFRHLRAPLLLLGVAAVSLLSSTPPLKTCKACDETVVRRSSGYPAFCEKCWIAIPVKERRRWQDAKARASARIRSHGGPALLAQKRIEDQIAAKIRAARVLRGKDG